VEDLLKFPENIECCEELNEPQEMLNSVLVQLHPHLFEEAVSTPVASQQESQKSGTSSQKSVLNLSAISIQDPEELMSQIRRCSRYATRHAPDSPGSDHLFQAQFHLAQHIAQKRFGFNGLPV